MYLSIENQTKIAITSFEKQNKNKKKKVQNIKWLRSVSAFCVVKGTLNKHRRTQMLSIKTKKQKLNKIILLGSQ